MPYGNRNCWDCPHCEQYNGFQEVRGHWRAHGDREATPLSCPLSQGPSPQPWPCIPPLRMGKQTQEVEVTCPKSHH